VSVSASRATPRCASGSTATPDRKPSPEYCVAIERATEGKVSRRDLRPDDWAAIWPELIGADGAPKAPGWDGVERRHAA
jgi:hypothetical protein